MCFAFSSFPRPRATEKVLESTYHGLIKENETFVELMPQLRVDAKICGFHILRNTHKGDIPFQVRRPKKKKSRGRETTKPWLLLPRGDHCRSPSGHLSPWCCRIKAGELHGLESLA